MHHLEGNTSFDERLIHAKLWIFDQTMHIHRPGIELGCLLRINNAEASYWDGIAKVFLILEVPDVQIFYNLLAALIVELTRDHIEPGSQAICHAILHP